ncbi:MAG: hypothetical protein M0009_04020 [Deltaproteobacteria bacterium]|nr:hypothetical protein [Deltaproteobacteria bacterium]
MEYPRWVKVRQNLDGSRDECPALSVEKQLVSFEKQLSFKKGDKIAITVGSRYIANLVPITKAVVDFIRFRGGQPFLVPAMGSHGGATAEGQTEVLAEYGFTEEALGVPILSSMDVDLLGEVCGIPVFIDRHAHAAEGIVVINRVKPHQVFKGEIQSGLNKMLAVGLGKKKGADAVHSSGQTDVLGTIGDFIRSKVPVLFGVAILENSYDETKEVAVVLPDRFREIDRTWVKVSRAVMPKIPFRNLDLAIVSEMGKDISGSGMDTNVIGFTRRIDTMGQVAVPLAVLDLTAKTDGNAIGIGLADFTTERLVRQIDRHKTYTNVLATGVFSAGRIPITLESERAIVDLILGASAVPREPRMIKIKNTLELEHFFVTEALVPEVEMNNALSLDGPLLETRFDDSENIVFR